jgi:hypothetical protein
MHRVLAACVYAIGRQTAAGVQLLGTGFAASDNHIATTAHVTGPESGGLVYIAPKLNDLYTYQDTTDNSVQFAHVDIVSYDPIRDVAILGDPDRALHFVRPYALASSDIAPPGTTVASLGFPHADHGRLVLTEQRTSVGARVILGSDGIKTKHLILNIQTRPGQSGSPVFSKDGSQVVAMVSGSYAPGGRSGISLGGIDPQTLHQTTHAISAEYISELLP